jgi:hypothetical protein
MRSRSNQSSVLVATANQCTTHIDHSATLQWKLEKKPPQPALCGAAKSFQHDQLHAYNKQNDNQSLVDNQDMLATTLTNQECLLSSSCQKQQ